jgi:alkylhydroperoxidase family enzyme
MATRSRLPLPSGGDDLASRSALGHQPEALTAFNRLYATLWSRGRIDPAILELARLRNARVTDCGI